MKLYVKSEDYFISHRPSDPRQYPDEVATIDKIETMDIFPDDVLDNCRFYADGSTSDGKRSAAIMKRLQGKPNAEVTIYRGSPKPELNTGDWVTLLRYYAENYAEGGGYGSNGAKVHSYKVKAKDLSWDGDSFLEFGYWGPKLVAE